MLALYHNAAMDLPQKALEISTLISLRSSKAILWDIFLLPCCLAQIKSMKITIERKRKEYPELMPII
jgi:hypothetical protein